MFSAFIRKWIPEDSPRAECDSQRIVAAREHNGSYRLIEEPGLYRSITRIKAMNEKTIDIGPIQRLFAVVPHETFTAAIAYRRYAGRLFSQEHTISLTADNDCYLILKVI